MKKLWQKITHEPVAFWTGLLTIAGAVLTSTGVFPEVAGIISTVVVVLGGAAVRQTVTPVAGLTDDTSSSMRQP